MIIRLQCYAEKVTEGIIVLAFHINMDFPDKNDAVSITTADYYAVTKYL